MYPDSFQQGFFFSIDMQFNDCIQFTRFLSGQITDGFFVKFVSLLWNLLDHQGKEKTMKNHFVLHCRLLMIM